jgi:hypothetical protein
MTEPTKEKNTVPDRNSGLFKQLFSKLDRAMKEKADTQAKENSCCSDDSNGKGGKCC